MTCRDWQHLFQEHLDGADPAGLEEHLRACPDCVAHRPHVRQLLDGIALLGPPVPPPALTDRVTARLCAEAAARRRRRRLTSVVALAAAALLLLALGRVGWPFRGQPAGPVPAGPLAAAPAEPLRDSMAQAGDAVAALTARTATATVDQTTTLLPLVTGAALDPFAVALDGARPEDGPMPMDPPMAPLREASAGVSAGLAPVADSARRAVGLFFRDLPLGSNDPSATLNNPG
jgi:hypothetical protein